MTIYRHTNYHRHRHHRRRRFFLNLSHFSKDKEEEEGEEEEGEEEQKGRSWIQDGESLLVSLQYEICIKTVFNSITKI